ncbi:hypothetical protein AB0O47_38860 [Streptomyces noursei]
MKAMGPLRWLLSRRSLKPLPSWYMRGVRERQFRDAPESARVMRGV